MEALDDISRRTICAVAMLGVGEVPECLMRRLVNECVTEGSERDESSFFILQGRETKVGAWVVAIE